jgi:hypothetical protein
VVEKIAKCDLDVCGTSSTVTQICLYYDMFRSYFVISNPSFPVSKRLSR